MFLVWIFGLICQLKKLIISSYRRNRRNWEILYTFLGREKCNFIIKRILWSCLLYFSERRRWSDALQASAFVPGDPLIYGIWWAAWLIKILGNPQKSPSTIYIGWWFHSDCWGDLIEIWVIAWALIWGLPIILFTLDRFKSMLIQYADLSAKILLEIHVL